jgi:uncharacterized protein involved in exopolysaccharide biosynthesis
VASDREITLGDIGGTIWRGKWYVVLAAVLGGVIGLLLTFTGATRYTASSQVYLGQATTMMGNLAQTAGTNPLTAATILQGDAIVDEVAAKTGLTRGQVRSDSDISVSRAPGTTNTNQPAIALITARTDSRDGSIALANTYADVALGGANTGYAVVLKTLEGQVRTGQAAVARLAGQLKGAGANQALVASQLATQETNLATAQLQLARVQQIEAPAVVSKATSAASSSSSRNRVRTIIIGALIGLLLGLVVALVIGGTRRRGAGAA